MSPAIPQESPSESLAARIRAEVPNVNAYDSNGSVMVYGDRINLTICPVPDRPGLWYLPPCTGNADFVVGALRLGAPHETLLSRLATEAPALAWEQNKTGNVWLARASDETPLLSIARRKNGTYAVHSEHGFVDLPADFSLAREGLTREAAILLAKSFAEDWRALHTEAEDQTLAGLLSQPPPLAERLRETVPDAQVSTTNDGIEVRVGSKSVRWKRERNGWSMDDDLFCSDERVIEHTQRMAQQDRDLARESASTPEGVLWMIEQFHRYDYSVVFSRPSQDTRWRVSFQSGESKVELLYARDCGDWTQTEPTHSSWMPGPKMLEHLGLWKTIDTQPTGAQTMQPTLATLQADATSAAHRTAAKQFVKLAREPLVGLLTRHLAPGDEAFRGRLAAFLQTELGTSLLAAMLSVGIGSIPNLPPVASVLSRELRVKAMADGGDVLADVLIAPLRDVARLYLQDPQTQATLAALEPSTAQRAVFEQVREEVGR